MIEPGATNCLLNFIYPVGSLYWTENDSFDPNVKFGGTWEQIENRFIYASKGTSKLQDGSNSVTLSSSNLPKHTHTFSGTTGNESAGHTHSFSWSGTTSDNGAWAVDIRRFYDSGNNLFFNGSNFYETLDGGSSSQVQIDSTNSRWATTNRIGSNNHSHTYSGSSTTGDRSANHTHGYSGTTSDGGFSNTAFSNMPQYETAHCWRRTA